MEELGRTGVQIRVEFSEQAALRIRRLVAKGLHVVPAGKAVGVGEKLMGEWIRDGRAQLAQYKNTPLARFVVSLDAAEAELERSIVAAYFKSCKLRPSDSAKFLAQRFPARWNPAGSNAGQTSGAVVNIQVVKYSMPRPVANSQITGCQHPEQIALTVKAEGGFKPKREECFGGKIVPYDAPGEMSLESDG